jgi:transcriptional regulator with XRE-family HTH domain
MAMIRQPENFPETVKEVRRQVGLSQEDLARALGVSFATVNRWENGKTVPSKLAQRQFEQFCKDQVKKGSLEMDEVKKWADFSFINR